MEVMTKRERVLKAIRFEETDRVPLYDILQNDAVIEHYAGRRLTYDDGDWTVGLAVGAVLDMTRMVNGPARPERVVHPDGTISRRERWTQWVEERPFHDLTELIPWVKEQIRRAEAARFDGHKPTMDAYIDRRIAAFAAADPTGRHDPAVLVIESGVGLDGMYAAAGMELFTYLWMEEPALVEEWLDARNRMELRRVAAIADPRRIPVALTYDDIAYHNGTLFDPAWLREHWAPRLKRLVDAWHERDTYCLYHSDGNLWMILDELVAAGIDGLNPLEVLAGMTVGEVRRRYPQLFLTGGIDVSQLLTHGSPDDVRTACREAIRDSGGRGYFLGSSTELHWDVPLENAKAMFEVAMESQGAQAAH